MDVSELSSRDASHDKLFRLSRFPRSERRRKHVLGMSADHAVDDFGDGEPLAIPSRHVLAISGYRDAIGDGEDLLEAMRNVQHCDAPLSELAQHRKEAFGVALVERRIRFVKDEQPRLLEEDARKLDELLLADAEAAQGRIHIHV